jgi:hypothetical protein
MVKRRAESSRTFERERKSRSYIFWELQRASKSTS